MTTARSGRCTIRAKFRRCCEGFGSRSSSAGAASSPSNRTAPSSWSAAAGCRALIFPGFRDIRGYQAMYRDFRRAIREGREPEMSLERAVEDQRLMDQVYASVGPLPAARDRQVAPGAARAVSKHYDVIIIGSGAGGGTMARALSQAPARVLVLERGGSVPQEAENWNPEAVWKHLRYRTTERWLDAPGDEFLPYTHYGVGGNTKFWGSVLYRLRREDFQAVEHTRRRLAGVADRLRHAGAVLRSAPNVCTTCTGGTAAIPRSLHAGRFPTRRSPTHRGMPAIVERLGDRDCTRPAFRSGSSVPASTGAASSATPATRFPCQIHAKSDAEVCGIAPALAAPNVELWTNAQALRLVTDPTGRRVDAVEVERDGATIRVGARSSSSSCGAVNSAALLLRSALGQASGWSWQFVWARRPALHGASCDDDAGLQSAAQERHGLPEDRGASTISISAARTQNILSATSSRRGERTASWRRPSTHGCRSGLTMRGCRAAWTGSRCPRICRARTTA